jgi:class 3 adenylate cyclase/tetratricopeptide (TPR) repeat protein
MLICSHCQQKNRIGAFYCKHCGSALACPRCRVILDEPAGYCDNCGQALASDSMFRVLPPAQIQEEPLEEPLVDLESTQPTTLPADGRATKVPSDPRLTSDLEQFVPQELMAKLEAARRSGEMVGERRVVTMLFCDVKGSTATAGQLDPEEWTEIINGAFEYMIKPVYKYEGTVARLMGDGILAFFGAPIAHEDDPQRAVLAGLDIVEQLSTYGERIDQTWGIDINVRVGINTGLVVVGTVGSDLRMEYSAMGDAINLAARMEQTAEPGTVQIAYDTYKHVKPFFEIEDLGGITIKGKEEPVPTYRVLGRKAKAGRQRGIEGLQAPLVGRDHELSTLQDVLISVQQGVGHIVCVIGEAGLGKSRLIHEAEGSLGNDQPLNWVETASLSYETNQPYAPFQRLIRRLNNMSPGDSAEQVKQKLAELCYPFDESDERRAQRVFETLFDLESDGQPPLEGEAFKRELYEMMPILWRLRFSRQPTVLVIDDIHWSDPASIDLLLHLLPLTAEIPLVLICAFRPDRNGPVWRIKTTADEEYHHLYTEIAIRPLSDKQVNQLIDGLLINTDLPQGLRERILESAGGNPFFVEEVVRSLIDNQALVAEEIEQDGQKMLYWRARGNGQQIDIPDNLQSLLSARIDRLEEETKQILQTAAVIGRTFYRRVLEAIEAQSQVTAQVIERQLNMLLRLEMIREAARRPELEYKFSNPLTQEVAYQTILLKRRRELHRQVGQALEELFPDQLGELAPLLAYHFSEGDLQEKAFDYYLMAGDSAARLFANIEALDHYTRALDYIDSVDPGYEKLKTLFSRRGRALELLARYDESLENYEAMLQLARDRDDKRLELAAKMAQATIRSIPSQVFDAEMSLQLSEDALNLAHELGESSAEAKINWNLMLYYLWGGNFQFEQAVKY